MSYVAGLLAGAGFLSLLNPLALLMAAPSLAINLLSNYPVMYSGVSHYSAPLAPWVIVSAVLGAAWLRGRAARLGERAVRVVSALLLIWLLVWALGYHAAYGFTPLGGRFHLPRVTEHNRLAQRFLDQIPAQARAVHPAGALPPRQPPRVHLRVSHCRRRRVRLAGRDLLRGHAPQRFPQAVRPDGGRRRLRHRRRARTATFCSSAALAGPPELPDAFCSFALAGDRKPQVSTDLLFGDELRLVGFDLYETIEDGKAWTGLRTYWQALKPLAGDLRVYPFFFDDAGKVLEDTSQRPVVTPIWCPPPRWPVGQTVVLDKLPWPVGDRFNLGLGVARGGGLGAARQPPGDPPDAGRRRPAGAWA